MPPIAAGLILVLRAWMSLDFCILKPVFGTSSDGFALKTFEVIFMSEDLFRVNFCFYSTESEFLLNEFVAIAGDLTRFHCFFGVPGCSKIDADYTSDSTLFTMISTFRVPY